MKVIRQHDHVVTQTTIDDNWERALLDEAKVVTDSGLPEAVVLSTTAWSNSSELLNYANALSTKLVAQARELLQVDCRMAIDRRVYH